MNFSNEYEHKESLFMAIRVILEFAIINFNLGVKMIKKRKYDTSVKMNEKSGRLSICEEIVEEELLNKRWDPNKIIHEENMRNAGEVGRPPER
jgi:hypothetical protein